MKILSIILLFLCGVMENPVQETSTIMATYSGMQNDQFVFTDDEGEVYAFDSAPETVLETFDLAGNHLVGSYFKVSYEELEEEDDEGESYVSMTITALELIK